MLYTNRVFYHPVLHKFFYRACAIVPMSLLRLCPLVPVPPLPRPASSPTPASFFFPNSGAVTKFSPSFRRKKFVTCDL